MRTVFPDAEELRLKSNFLGDNPGYFVEVGANDPRIQSQTWDLEQRGWDGVLVEPQPPIAARLRRERSAKVFEVACSSRNNAGSAMPLYLANGHSSFDRNLNIPTVIPSGVIDVPVRTLDAILVEAAARPGIDFVSIDVEGHEVDVIDGFDLSRWQPRLLMVEDLLLGTRLHRCLTDRGYSWFRRTGINNWYVPSAARPPLGFDGWWQFCNKHYLGLPSRRLRAAWKRRTSDPQPVNT